MLSISRYFLVLLLIAACTKERVALCPGNIELNDRDHLVDIGPLQQAPELLDTLKKYPELRVFKIIDNKYSIGVKCDIFYRGLLIFTDQYILSKGKIHPVLGPEGSPNIQDTIPVPLEPSITIEKAEQIARNSQVFGTACIRYRLGIWDENAGRGTDVKDYHLTWKLESVDGYPVVVVDAVSGGVLYSDDGIRY